MITFYEVVYIHAARMLMSGKIIICDVMEWGALYRKKKKTQLNVVYRKYQ